MSLFGDHLYISRRQTQTLARPTWPGLSSQRFAIDHSKWALLKEYQTTVFSCLKAKGIQVVLLEDFTKNKAEI